MNTHTLIHESEYVTRIASLLANDLYNTEQMRLTTAGGPSQAAFWALTPARRLSLYLETLPLIHRWNADERAALTVLANKYLNGLKG